VPDLGLVGGGVLEDDDDLLTSTVLSDDAADDDEAWSDAADVAAGEGGQVSSLAGARLIFLCGSKANKNETCRHPHVTTSGQTSARITKDPRRPGP